MRALGIGLGLLAVLSATALHCSKPSEKRGAGTVQQFAGVPPEKFVPAEAAGLFVGVRTFRHGDTLPVPYAADDAVDLAYSFALSPRVGLIPPRRVIVVVSDPPQKEDSKGRLAELKEAGATIVYDATADDILNLFRKQAALTGSNGLLVLSLATHGFQYDGEAYILGSTSSFESPETALRLATLLDAAANVPRSLIFVDACRDRIGQTSRSATPDPATAAMHIKGMGRVQGQVIFYAAAPGQYAYDDHAHQNGVFTKAVLDGMVRCKAPSPGGKVLAETLHSYVDREVRRWIRKNKNLTVNPATQVSMEGETRRMPLAECWQPCRRRIRVAFDDSIITAYGHDTRPLWRRDLQRPIVDAQVADLDADGFSEVVVGLHHELVVLDRNGQPRWKQNGHSAALRTFTTGDLFEKRNDSVVAVWYDERAATSLLKILDGDGNEHSILEYPGELQHVAVGRPTRMHAPKIVATTRTSLLVLSPRKLEQGKPLWHQALRSPGDTIRDLRILDANDDKRLDIHVKTAAGATWFDFDDGAILRQSAGALWSKASTQKRTARPAAPPR